MHYPREEKRDFLQLLSTLSLIAIIPLAIIALISGQGASIALLTASKTHYQATIKTIEKTANQDINIIHYSYKSKTETLSDIYIQYRKNDETKYNLNDSLPIVYSPAFPSINLPEAAYVSGQLDGKIFTSCIAGILLLIGISFFALTRQRKHAAEDFYY